MLETFLRNKKNLLYLAVLAGAVFLICLGVFICEKITDGAEQKARLYQTAVQVIDDEQLNYSIDTKQGRVLARTTVNPADLVKFPEMNKSYSYVEKTKEEYVEKTRQVCTDTYDAEGNVTGESCHTETYYEWDYVDSEELKATQVTVAGRKYPIDLFSLRTQSIDAKDIINGQEDTYVYERSKGGIFGRAWFSSDTEGDIRYSYDVMQLPQSGTMFLNTSESFRPMFGSKVDLQSKSPQELVKSSRDSVTVYRTVFIILWGILVMIELIALSLVVYQYEV